MATELKVCDLEIACYADMVLQWDHIDSAMEDYLKVLADVKDKAVKSGETHESIELLHMFANDVYTKMLGLGSKASKDAESFLSKIEDADLNLYNGV